MYTIGNGMYTIYNCRLQKSLPRKSVPHIFNESAVRTVPICFWPSSYGFPSDDPKQEIPHATEWEILIIAYITVTDNYCPINNINNIFTEYEQLVLHNKFIVSFGYSLIVVGLQLFFDNQKRGQIIVCWIARVSLRWIAQVSDAQICGGRRRQLSVIFGSGGAWLAVLPGRGYRLCSFMTQTVFERTQYSNILRRGIFLNEQHKRTKYLVQFHDGYRLIGLPLEILLIARLFSFLWLLIG